MTRESGLDMTKPYKGRIKVLEKVDLSHMSKELDEMYGPSLHYYYKVNWLEHPKFRTLEERLGGQTSLVVYEHDNQDGTFEIETLNSRYMRNSDHRYD